MSDGGHTEPSEGGLRMPSDAVATGSSHDSCAAVNRLLSDEIILRIWQYLGAAELARLQCVCRRFNSLAADPQIWKVLYLDTFVGDWIRLQRQLDPTLPRMFGKPDPQRLLLSLRKQGGSSRAYWGLPEQYYIRDTQRIGDDDIHARRLRQRNDRHGLVYSASSRDGLREENFDWQALFRVSSNWRKGRFAFSELSDATEQDVPPAAAEPSSRAQQPPKLASCAVPAPGTATGSCSGGPNVASNREASAPAEATTLIASAGNLIFTATRLPYEDPEHSAHGMDSAPCVKVYRTPVQSATLRSTAAASSQDLAPTSPALEVRSKALRAAISSRKVGMPTITDVQADTASSSAKIRLFVAYSSGDWSVFCLSTEPWTAITATEEVFCERSSPTSPQSSVMSSFHYPILATCTEDFDISIFKLSDYKTPASTEKKISVTLLRRMKGPNCHWPASMSLASIAVAHSEAVTSGQKIGDRKRKRTSSPTRSDTNSTPGAYPSSTFAGLKEARKRRRLCDAQMPLQSEVSSDICVEVSNPTQAIRLDIAYSSPCYPNNWSISIQEIVIVLDGLDMGGSASITSRYATARPRSTGQLPRPDVSHGDASFGEHQEDDARVPLTGPERPQRSPSQAGTQRSIFHSTAGIGGRPSGDRPAHGSSRITSITSDERTLIAGSVDNVLDVYKISGSMKQAALTSYTGTPGSTQQDLTLEHRQVLHGHGASVSSVALTGNRIVSGSTDGNIMVWTLEQSSDLVSSRSHAITLRTPSPLPTTPSSKTDDALPGTLYRLLGRARAAHLQRTLCLSKSGTSAAQQAISLTPRRVKRVTTTFDRILSVTGAAQSDLSERPEEFSVEKSEDLRKSNHHGRGEKIQVWSFAG
ncbi:hypothetical protein BCV69DRAFT_278558 [Microstroma glucosiphilum]|uniref:F-box domain-containing protein n=1 Tax=Pseudomicrostroma glucosiphilum TaxID=1684307 RepID=A0A316U2F9_9BASI|nr:hypothetical protein BCV69DRAFT_278558 [Pseudomicrostroma glucosiphilum]PWN19004.1 hypothetical protein BCV69DRAFT_278558 [Pseudomicrostroma glucosiphilum]